MADPVPAYLLIHLCSILDTAKCSKSCVIRDVICSGARAEMFLINTTQNGDKFDVT